jgi:hypothetical protein
VPYASAAAQGPAGGIVIALYLTTLIGGWLTYPRDLQAEAVAEWEATPAKYRLKDGPVTSMCCCLPVLPGLLIAWSEVTIGPINCAGGPTLVVYYGWGSATVLRVPFWVS